MQDDALNDYVEPAQENQNMDITPTNLDQNQINMLQNAEYLQQ